jgi:hypothetical protein
MCNHNSFSATADTLTEVVALVDLHIRQQKDTGYPSHKEYFLEHPGTQEHMTELEISDNTKAILDSPFFAWTIAGLVGFDKIVELAKIPPFPQLSQPSAGPSLPKPIPRT